MLAQNAAVQGADACAAIRGNPATKARGEKGGREGRQGREEGREEETPGNRGPNNFNFHAQITAVAQGDPGFAANYSGPNSLNSAGERQETRYGGPVCRRAAVAWRRDARGCPDVAGLRPDPNVRHRGFSQRRRLQSRHRRFPTLCSRTCSFVKPFGLGGEQEDVPDGQLTLAGKQDISRLTFTIGRFTPTDMFDNNTYAHDPHTQFLNWAMIANLTWDYPADTVGFTTGLAVELNQPDWALRYGFFQMPGVPERFHRGRPDFHVAQRRQRRRFLALLGNDGGTRTPLEGQRSSGGDSVSGLARRGQFCQLQRGDCLSAG